jgi:hypothetical protein
MNYERAMVKVDEYIGLCTNAIGICRELSTAAFKDPTWQDLSRQITEGLPLIETIAQRGGSTTHRPTSCSGSGYPVQGQVGSLPGASSGHS